MKIASELAEERRAWGASIRDVVNSIGDAGTIRPGVIQSINLITRHESDSSVSVLIKLEKNLFLDFYHSSVSCSVRRQGHARTTRRAINATAGLIVRLSRVGAYRNACSDIFAKVCSPEQSSL